MIIVLKNYPSVVDAKAFVVEVGKNQLVAEATTAMAAAKENSNNVYLPPCVSSNPRQIVGVTFDDAEDAVKQMYDYSWESLVQYGDLMLVGNRLEMLKFPNSYQVYCWMKNDRGTQMSIIFDFKKYMIIDPNRKSHKKGKCIVNYCSPNIRPDMRDANALTIISLMKEDEILIEDDVISVIPSDPADMSSFSALL